METGKTAQAGQVPAVVKATRIIDTLAQSPRPLGTSELARQLGLPKSSVHLICTTLLSLDMLVRRGENQYSVGPHVLQWADAFQGQSDLVREFQQMTSEHTILPELALNLTVLNGSDVMYVACRNGSQPLGVRFSVGMVLPAAFTATGKAILCTRPTNEVKRVMGGKWPEPMTSNSPRSIGQFVSELADTRHRGYSIDNGQLREGMYCLAAPIFSAGSADAVAGIAVGLLQSEVTPENEARISAELIEFANELSRRLGGRVPELEQISV